MRFSFGALMGLAACGGPASAETVTIPELVGPAVGSPAVGTERPVEEVAPASVGPATPDAPGAAPPVSDPASATPATAWRVKMLVAPPPRSSHPRCTVGAAVNCDLPSVQGVIAKLAPGFSRCVARAAAAAPTAIPFAASAPGSQGGPYYLQMRAGPNGEVLAVTPVQMEGLSPVAVDCIVERAVIARFPPPDGPRADTLIDVRFVVLPPPPLRSSPRWAPGHPPLPPLQGGP